MIDFLDDKRAAVNPVRWGVLGTASIALERTVPAIGKTSNATCIAIASRNLERARTAAAQLGIPRAYGSYEEVIVDEDVEAVYIPLPNQLHVQWSERALRAGKAVLCEKPLSLNASDIATLIDVRDETSGLIEEALVFRNHPQWTFISEVLESKQIGDPVAVQGTIAKRFLNPNDIRNQPQLGGGATYDLGTYVIAACNLVFRRSPLKVSACIDLDPEWKIDRLVTAVLDYGDAHASFTASSQAGTDGWGTHQQFSILGTKGWLRCNFPFAHARPVKCRIEIGGNESVGSIATTVRQFDAHNQYALQIERFSRLVRGEDARRWPIEDALMTLEVIESIFQSARDSQRPEMG